MKAVAISHPTMNSPSLPKITLRAVLALVPAALALGQTPPPGNPADADETIVLDGAFHLNNKRRQDQIKGATE